MGDLPPARPVQHAQQLTVRIAEAAAQLDQHRLRGYVPAWTAVPASDESLDVLDQHPQPQRIVHRAGEAQPLVEAGGGLIKRIHDQ
jgi:hypothetical protein